MATVAEVVVPEQFSDMSQEEFAQFVTCMPFGDRLYHPESWREAIYVRGFMDYISRSEKRNPLGGRIPEEICPGPLEGRPLRICLAFIRWFGTNCGQPAIEALLKEMDLTAWPSNEDLFHRRWDHNARTLTYLFFPGGSLLTEGQMRLDDLLNEGHPGDLLPSDFATPADAITAHALMEWFDSIIGTQYLCEMQAAIQAVYKRHDERRQRELKESQLRHESERLLQKAHQLAQAVQDEARSKIVAIYKSAEIPVPPEYVEVP